MLYLYLLVKFRLFYPCFYRILSRFFYLCRKMFQQCFSNQNTRYKRCLTIQNNN